MSLGQSVIMYRRDQLMSRATLAQKVGCRLHVITEIELDQRQLSNRLLKDLCKALNVKRDDLLW